ncbi:MAG: N-succinylarginine dihydrolase [Tepidisphaeraceae bacterium]
MSGAVEVNFDGLVGPTHNYAGLSYGNPASMTHRGTVSSPRQAALQGLAKMKFLADLGLKQAVLPPQERPDVSTLRRIGFCGSDADVLAKAHRDDPILLAAVCSSSSMWAANAATVSPASDTADGRTHFTPANLVSHFHRSLETDSTATALRAIFHDETFFAHHAPLPATTHLSDEGAANHTRLSARHGERGVELFTIGRIALDPASPLPSRFPARQTREASQAIARLHGLDPARTIFVRQNPIAIAAGAFHNDVVAVGNESVLFCHELAFADRDRAVDEIRQTFARTCARELALIEVPDAIVPLADAVASYLFNSQLVTLSGGAMALIAPVEARDNPRTRPFLDDLVSRGGPIRAVHYVDLRQSMQNGGGPACLRLRVVLTEDQLRATRPSVFLTDALHAQLKSWIERRYRDALRDEDLADPQLLDEGRAALDELTRILGLGSLYEFLA